MIAQATYNIFRHKGHAAQLTFRNCKLENYKKGKIKYLYEDNKKPKVKIN